MTEFIQQDLSGARFDQVLLSGATFHKVRLNDAHLRDVDLRGIAVHGAVITGRMRGVEFWDLELNGEIGHLSVNGVDVGPLVEAELDRQMPDRVLMRPTDPDGFRKGFATIEDTWDATVEHARTFPPEALHRSIDDEWSFIQTLRHLNFATVCWVGRVVGDGNPWHPSTSRGTRRLAGTA
ncbi:MAG: DinB family protein, partial [Propionibacteriaceae bacterium]